MINWRCSNSAEVYCEKLRDSRFLNTTERWCHMEKTTKINLTGVTISSKRDDSVKVITFSGNRQIFFLPIRVHEKLPSLVDIYADRCSISVITKINFEGLSQLESLFLNSNKIKRINGDTFEGLTKLREIFLSMKLI